eukprot:CAMPEP_0202861560 /NCGR_PEP_ID=MMETSP1391-20130828/2916_1 /ASSEMBLY_ACC=CAM_ASM_000867 /TAXON_ID=1034604 /ORGANISM="Chlamydomonas leiostraca, Strain SAG 11-49" /LENGTH=273 /DNA_ID=CAMNT_0049540969 /DNA_START=1 /DNA_END=822 /DNA_ORIENTATION=+
MIVDDDTFVHPWNLLAIISQQMADGSVDDTSETIIGHHWSGGAGFLFAPGAIQKLTSRIAVHDLTWNAHNSSWSTDTGSTGHTYLEACLHRMMGGSWCYQHSDHIWGRCAKSAGIRMVQDSNMVQFCPVGTTLWINGKYGPNTIRNVSMADNSTQSWLRSTMVSCHYMDRQAMHTIYDHIHDTWSPEKQSQQQPWQKRKRIIGGAELRQRLSTLQARFAAHREEQSKQQLRDGLLAIQKLSTRAKLVRGGVHRSAGTLNNLINKKEEADESHE